MKRIKLNRRKFTAVLGAGAAALAVNPVKAILPENLLQQRRKPATNIGDALKTPRTNLSMPGKFPGKVVKMVSPASVVNDEPVEKEAYKMISRAMLDLTGEKSLKKAWLSFVKPGETIGLKVNPVAGKLLSTSHAVTKAVVSQLTECGISRKDIVIWDRRDMQLREVGFTGNNYPGIRIAGTELKDSEGSFFDKNGKLYGEANIDSDWFYWADVDGVYDAETMPYMINGGKHSYFSKIVTKELDKIINIPILKNAGSSVTNAMKNLAFGAISNTARLHTDLWNETCAEVCAFAPLRDKVVLNITDGLRGCFNGGPGANPQFICNYNTILVSTDPVATDRIAYDIIAEKRVAEGLIKAPDPSVLTFLNLASGLGLGVSDKDRIELIEGQLS